jgi:hypothetical protein
MLGPRSTEVLATQEPVRLAVHSRRTGSEKRSAHRRGINNDSGDGLLSLRRRDQPEKFGLFNVSTLGNGTQVRSL